MFYSSNLRKMLILPSYEPEINNDADIVNNGIDTIYAAVPQESLPLLAFYHSEVANADKDNDG